MDIVVDASAIIAAIANEPEKKRIIKKTQGCSLIAPSSVHWEIGNAFSAMLKRKKATQKLIARALSVCETIPIRFVDIDLGSALEIAGKSSIYAYDAYLVSCALQFKCPLLTLDKGLMRVAINNNVKLVEV